MSSLETVTLVEKFIVNPRHIEVQILADKKGNTFHFLKESVLFKEDIKKIIEEAPSPFMVKTKL